MEYLIAILLMTALLEVIRHKLIIKTCNHSFHKAQILPSALIIISATLPFIWVNWITVLICLAACDIEMLIFFLIWKNRTDGFQTKKHWGIFFGSYLIPLAICLATFLFNQKVEQDAFDKSWQQTPVLIITQDPQPLVYLHQDQQRVFETNNGQDIIVRDTPEYMKLQKGDKIKYLKIGNNERLEIITLRGIPYQK